MHDGKIVAYFLQGNDKLCEMRCDTLAEARCATGVDKREIERIVRLNRLLVHAKSARRIVTGTADETNGWVFVYARDLSMPSCA